MISKRAVCITSKDNKDGSRTYHGTIKVWVESKLGPQLVNDIKAIEYLQRELTYRLEQLIFGKVRQDATEAYLTMEEIVFQILSNKVPPMMGRDKIHDAFQPLLRSGFVDDRFVESEARYPRWVLDDLCRRGIINGQQREQLMEEKLDERSTR